MLKAIIEGVEIHGTAFEILQYKNMVDAQKNNVKQTPHYIIHFPAGHIPSPSDSSVYGKQITNDITKMFGNQYYQQ